ncbi:MAG TPA: glycoside hydrolase family 38 C-terminal domain-containing protein [Candidatus Hydrogenedentes bacterium]|nr:glycoside hydrolase family 38 C-terminal domain-containing protein [Candidatus Hydrogenedentota bacterium]HPG67149.1 glycoside hydrolase family 38 C-terminal domain-containing protein [Candidatus Hydrogenedentota bacterium]
MTPNRLSDLAAGQTVRDWLVLGPFVIRTGPHFEREYMYERERILDVDYLADSGGEASVQPALGQAHTNVGLGPKTLRWRAHPEPDLYGVRIAGDIIYETVQRNGVVYAAALIDAEADTLALFDAQHSGMKAWMNGELVCNEPYGLTKGIGLTMTPKLVRLHRGANLLLVKFRPGYICDGVDFKVRAVMLSPMHAVEGCPLALGRIRPLPYFRGAPDRPRQVIEATVLNLSGQAVGAEVSVSCKKPRSEDTERVVCTPGEVTPIRLALDAPPRVEGQTLRGVYAARANGALVSVPFSWKAAKAPERAGTAFVTSSFHFDTTYHEEQRVYAMGAFDIVRDYCRLHREDPNFKSIISEVDYLKPYIDVYPEDRETLFAVFRDGRSEPDVMYNQPNEQTCGGEALVRNFLYGQLIHGRVFGNRCSVYGPGDVFGHPNQISQIARKSGCIGISWDKYLFNLPPIFHHLALDGIAIPHKRDYVCIDDVRDMGLTVGMGRIDQTPPTDWHGTLTPTYRAGTYGDLLGEVNRQCDAGEARLPVVSRDISLYHAATALSRTNLKIANRLGENVLITAEKFATLAALLGAQYPEKALDKAWRQILCGQHHDSITGTHNEISFVDLMNAYREVLELGGDVLDKSLDYIGRAIDAGVKRPLTVFNSLAWPRTDVVRAEVALDGLERFAIADRKGRRVPFEVTRWHRDATGKARSAEICFVARNVPSLGYRTYQVVAADKAVPEVVTQAGTIVENAFYRIEVDPERGGGIVSLYDKKAGREVMKTDAGHVGNELAILEEVPDRRETQHEFYTTGLKMFSADSPASVEVRKGPISATLRIRYAMGEHCVVVQEIAVYQGVPRIECRTILDDVQGEDYLYCVTFPTNLEGVVPVFDERFGVVSRNDSKNYLDFRTHRQIMFSDCAVYAANKWMEYGPNATLRVGRNQYALNMVGLITPNGRAEIDAAETIERAFITKGVTCTPWFDTDGPRWGTYQDHMDDDLLYTRFRIALGIGGNNQYAKRLMDKQPATVRKAFNARMKHKGHAFLFVLDGDLAQPGWPPLPVLMVDATSAENLTAACRKLTLELERSATVTLPADADATGEAHKVDDYGLALLNVGTYANSVERGGTLCMMLNHTCRWYGGTNNFPEGYLVPEQRTHAYVYAFYPHAGDWRKAGTQHAAHAFNFPLIARQAQPGKKPCRPAECAFVTVAPKNAILAAMKPFGNPIAGFEKNAVADPAQGIMLRLYDTEGVAGPARISFASGIREAWRANLLEEREGDLAVENGAVTLDMPAFSIETVGFVPERLGPKQGRRVLGTEAEPVQPVWLRSWEHDAESMPMGYGPVVASISRRVVEEEDGCLLRLRVNVVNDYVDAPVSGTATLDVPKGWRVEPSPIAFEVAPLGYQYVDVTVRRPDRDAPGQIKLRHAYDGQTFQDVLEIGAAFDLDIEVERRDNAILVHLANTTRETIESEAALVTPIELWPESCLGAHALFKADPRTHGVSLAPGEHRTLRFRVDGGLDPDLGLVPSYWAVVKLMTNGRIQLKRCDCRPPSRRLDDDAWSARYEAAVRARRG